MIALLAGCVTGGKVYEKRIQPERPKPIQVNTVKNVKTVRTPTNPIEPTTKNSAPNYSGPIWAAIAIGTVICFTLLFSVSGKK